MNTYIKYNDRGVALMNKIVHLTSWDAQNPEALVIIHYCLSIYFHINYLAGFSTSTGTCPYDKTTKWRMDRPTSLLESPVLVPELPDGIPEQTTLQSNVMQARKWHKVKRTTTTTTTATTTTTTTKHHHEMTIITRSEVKFLRSS